MIEGMLKMSVAQRLENVGEYYFSKKLREIDQMRASGKHIISLGIGSPDLPPHPYVAERLYDEARKRSTHGYQSYKGAPILRKAFADWYKKYYGVMLNPDNEILPLIGSKEGIMHICMTYINKGDKVLIPNPGYPTYRSAATIAGATIVEYKLTSENHWFPDFDEIEKNDLSGAKLMFLNYPHMPTGAKPTRWLFKQFIAFAKRHSILLVHDNPYSFIRNTEPMSLLSIPDAKFCAVELNSLSKCANMAGWRIGMVGGRKEFIDQIMRFKSNMDSGMFLPMQCAAAEALSVGNDWYEELNSVYFSREEIGYKLLDKLGCTYEKDQAGLFLWAKIPDDFEGDCYAFSDKILNESGVFITPGGIFGSEGSRYIRISLCAPEETLNEAVDLIKERIN